MKSERSSTVANFDGLYVHIPFCVRKCGYCDFYSEVASDAEMQRFLLAMERELGGHVERYGRIAPRTVFFGGGTPTKLRADQLEQLGEILHRHIDLSEVVEWTSEINPGTLNADKARALVAMGVNRASFGVQSFDEAQLKVLDRAHEYGKVDEALALAREAGIARINIDMIYALPGQTIATWEHDLEQALARKTQHLSLYTLIFEDDTALTQKWQRGEVQPIDDTLEGELYAWTLERLKSTPYAQYEISNYAQPGEECLHNLLYWEMGDWLGIGPGAHSSLGNQRWGNLADHRAWATSLLEAGSSPELFRDELTPEQVSDDLLLMGLRLNRGVSLQRFEQLCGISLADRCGPALQELVGLDLLELNETHLRATDAGRMVLDEVIVQLTRAPMRLGV